MNEVLRADCARCAGLCCMGLAFDRSALFAVDKPAGVACPHLRSNHQCGIHRERERRGFAGCVHYDCLGAGQRVTQELFEGRSWRDQPVLARPMLDAFRVLRQVHELLLLLQLADRLPLTLEQAERRAALQHALQPAPGWSVAGLAAFERSHLPSEIQAFFLTLQGHVSSQRRIRRRLRVLA